MLVLNMLLALAWAAVTGELSVQSLGAGFVVGYFVLWLVTRSLGESRYFAKAWRILLFALHFSWELLVAALRVAVDVVTPRHLIKPAILAIPVETSSAAETTTLANAITLTPGTLAIDISEDGKTMYVHAMYAKDVDSARRAIQQGLGKRVHEVFA
ncbi:MAG: Na+/H+ antiporter subunit E [Planctomycetota bacterium]|nr:MAG: Na+/H+ antiporter subunit E [Planctomycetota bacterium]REJ87519.1 MAG: Na+/H+ antiporter subunit E [Planctomycetota bacterium]REK31103.1 MAG: Na+/H+ antiporter subunit E [Planctomycetota bacterium]REK44349.1 MAG: Na+/H+ antiporter subunit E [Planctomycetota bacterium]